MKNKKNNRFSEMYRKGGEKQAWISKKISTLKDEHPDWSHDQIVAVALNMAENMHQIGGVVTNPYNLPTGDPLDLRVPTTVPTPQMNPVGQLSTWNPQPNNSYAPMVGQAPALTVEQSKNLLFGNTAQGQTSQPQTADTQARPQLTAAPDLTINQLAPATDVLSLEATQNRVKTSAEELNKEATQNDNTGLNLPTQQPFQFFNPYGDVDIPTAANFLGQSIEKGNALGIVAGGLKTGLGVARNLFAGMGQANVQEETMKKYYSDQRANMIGKPQSFQEGGEMMVNEVPQEQMPPQEQQDAQQQIIQFVAEALQQGIAPDEILQQLVSSGIPQEQAQMIIQQIMSQMQTQAPQQEAQPMMKNGGHYLDMMRGKKIKDYTYNKDTDSYTISYE